VRVVNVDATVVAEQPKVAPYAAQIAKNLAASLGIDEACVNVKGKTTEGLGFAGSGEGIAAYAVALVMKA
jgi:2-C-methyl-D-erythritol 2,4-cyclodiphosphate synthase